MILNSHNKSIGSIFHRLSAYQKCYIGYLILSIVDFFWGPKPISNIIHRIAAIARIILAFPTWLFSDMPISQSLHHIFSSWLYHYSKYAMHDVQCAKYKSQGAVCDVQSTMWLFPYPRYNISSIMWLLHLIECSHITNLSLQFSYVIYSNECLYAINI